MYDLKDKRFRFSVAHDILLLQEVLRINPYEHISKWKDVHHKFVKNNCINWMGSSTAVCSVRAVREHIDHLVKLYKKGQLINRRKYGNEAEWAEKTRLLEAAKKLMEETKEKKTKLKRKSYNTEEIGTDKAHQKSKELVGEEESNNSLTSTEIKTEDASSLDSMDNASILPDPEVPSLTSDTSEPSFSAIHFCETSFGAPQNKELSSSAAASRTTESSSVAPTNFESSSLVSNCYKSSSVVTKKSKTVAEMLNRSKTFSEIPNNFKHLPIAPKSSETLPGLPMNTVLVSVAPNNSQILSGDSNASKMLPVTSNGQDSMFVILNGGPTQSNHPEKRKNPEEDSSDLEYIKRKTILEYEMKMKELEVEEKRLQVEERKLQLKIKEEESKAEEAKREHDLKERKLTLDELELRARIQSDANRDKLMQDYIEINSLLVKELLQNISKNKE